MGLGPGGARPSDPRGRGRPGLGRRRRRLRDLHRARPARTPASACTPRTTRSSPSAPRSPSTWRAPGTASPSCRPATPGCSRWRRPWSRSPPTTTPTSPVRVVPGVSAAQAVAARVGAPLGHDYAMISLSDRLKPWDVVERRLAAVADADMAIAIYNPALAVADLAGRGGPRAAAEVPRPVHAGGRRPRRRRAGGVGARRAPRRPRRRAEVDMRTLLIVGSSSTRWPATGTVYTPRRHG